MGEPLVATAVWIGLATLAAAAVLLFWPYRRAWHFVHRRMVDASPEAIWDACDPATESAAYGTFGTRPVFSRKLRAVPETWELVIDNGCGHPEHNTTMRFETIHEDRPARSETRLLFYNGVDHPFGEAHIDTLEFDEQQGGTLVTLGFSGELSGLWRLLLLRRVNRSSLRRIQRHFGNGDDVPEVFKGQAFRTSVALSAVTVASFALLFG